MKNKIILSGLLLTMVFGAIAVNGKLSASDMTPGTASDPLVSQSYVDNKFNQLMNLVNSSGGGGNVSKDTIIAEVMAQVEFFYSKQSDSYTPVYATRNQIVLGDEGTEIILRSGTATGYCVGADGMVNATNGAEVMNGTPISKNNLLIVPRNDGRGARVTSDDAWFIVKGNYTITN